MKALATALFLAALIPFASAGIRLPSKIHEIADLEKAKTEAQQKGRPIAILLTDKDSTCPLCAAATEDIIKELGNKTVMVYARSSAGLPEAATSALSAGQYIPKVAVLDAAMTASLGSVTYEAIKEDPRKAFREVKKAIADYKAKK